MPRTQAERTESTTTGLVQVAVDLFGRDGYASVSLDDVARAAGVTKGAVYHHFGSKAELFRAAVIHTESRLVELVHAEITGEPDPWATLHRGCCTFLRACLDPGVARIVLLDGPAVLGWREMRALEDDYTTAMVRAGLERVSGPAEARARTHVLVGALCEAGLLLATEPDQLPALTRAIGGILDSYRAG